MGPRRPFRSFVALLTAALLLWCQTAYAVQACAQADASAAPVAAAAPCHDAQDDDARATHEPAAAIDCDSNKAFSQEAKLPIFALGDLPATPAVYYAAPRLSQATQVADTAHAVCHSPPLTLLHCRLLN